MSLTTEQVWNDFQAPLQQFIRTRVSDELTAEDILQEVFLKIHQRIGTLKEVKKLESWVYQITPMRLLITTEARSSRGLRSMHQRF